MKFGKGFEAYTAPEQQRIALGRQVASEGMVLLENNGALPLKVGAKVALFGVGQIGFLHGGSGSGGTFADYVVKLPEAMTLSGAAVDPDVLRLYADYCAAEQRKVEEIPPFMRRGTIQELPLPESEIAAAAARNDAAIFSLARLAGEGRDRTLEPGDYYLSDTEQAVLAALRRHFQTLVVLLNVCGTIDMNWVEQLRPDGVLMVWIPGQEGANAAADILMGHVNPSGRLTDTIAKAWRDIPSSENFGAWADGFELYTGDEQQIPYWGGVGNHAMVPVGETVVRPVGNRRFTEYQEGLYVGYRYFSTFGVEVAYPFGYGLSYTTFSAQPGDFRQTDRGVSFQVEVCNTGAVPGKEVVQIYLCGAQAPLERPSRELIAFAKTDLLAPGARQTLEFSVDYRTMAVYNPQRAAWMLQAGENTLYLGGDALHNRPFATFLTQELLLEQVSNQVVPRHTRPLRELSRRDPAGTRPLAPPILANSGEKHGAQPDRAFRWPEVPTDPGQWQLRDVRDGKVSMEKFLGQMTDFELVVLLIGANLTGHSAVETMDKTIEQAVSMEHMQKETQLGPLSECVPGMGGYTATVARLGIPTITMCDGPAGIGAGKEHKLAFPTATITACTWNTDLARQLGDALGGEAEERKVDVWLAPAFNLHRNPLAGRNYEYYSEDPLLSGKIAAAVVQGAEGGHRVSTCLKHFAANNQETSRWDKDDSVISERTLRELYLKSFEIAVKEGHPHCLMTSYNPLNGTQTAANRELLQNILREEWGFDGFVVTDWEGDAGLAEDCIRAGNDLLMPGFPGMVEWLYGRVQAGSLQRSALETCAGRLLKVVMHSAAMDRYLTQVS